MCQNSQDTDEARGSGSGKLFFVVLLSCLAQTLQLEIKDGLKICKTLDSAICRSGIVNVSKKHISEYSML